MKMKSMSTTSMNANPKAMPKGKTVSETMKAPKCKLPPFPGGKCNAQGNTP